MYKLGNSEVQPKYIQWQKHVGSLEDTYKYCMVALHMFVLNPVLESK